jgi:hypothetical protein
MPGYRQGNEGFNEEDQAAINANTTARHNRSHAVDSTSDHTVGSVAAGGFMVNTGGTWVDSIGETAKAGIINGTTYVLGGANTYIYGNLAYGGVPAGDANGGLIFNNLDGPLKLMCSARADAAGNKSVVIGTGISGTGPALDILSIGWWDTTGPTWYDVYEFAADGEIQTGTITSEYMVDKGKLTWDEGNNRFTNGFKDPNDNTIHAIWTEVGGAGGTFSKASGVTTITAPAAQQSEWTNGTYNAVRLETTTLPTYSDWEVFFHRTSDDANDTGTHFCVYFDGGNADFVNFQALKQAGAYKQLVYRGVSTILYNINDGADASWQRMAMIGGTIIVSHYNAAIGSVPTDGDWIEITRYAPVWPLHNITLFIAAMQITSNPGTTADFGQVTVRYL